MTAAVFSCLFYRSNLHIVLCMSPVGSNFRARCRMFPSLVNCCTIDWFTAWPREALLSVSKSAFEVVDFGRDDLKVGIIDAVIMLYVNFFYDIRRKLVRCVWRFTLQLATWPTASIMS